MISQNSAQEANVSLHGVERAMTEIRRGTGTIEDVSQITFQARDLCPVGHEAIRILLSEKSADSRADETGPSDNREVCTQAAGLSMLIVLSMT